MSDRLGDVLPCPTCGYRTDAATHVGGRDITPRPGDATICLSCGQVLFFDLAFIGLRLRLPTSDELADLLVDWRITATLAFRRAFDREPRLEVAP